MHSLRLASTVAVPLLAASASPSLTTLVARQNESQRPQAPVSNQELFVRRVLDLSRLAPFRPTDIAAVLACALGLARQGTEVRAEYDLSGSNLITEGTVSTGGDWVAVTLTPAPTLGLTLQDLEPLLLEFPYHMAVQTAHFPDGPRIRVLEHLFRVPVGMLVVEVAAGPSGSSYRAALERAYQDRVDVAGGKRSGRNPVESIIVTNEPRPGLEKAPTLRVFREWAQKQK